MGVKRGDLVTIAFPGRYGKPRPALVIQSDLFDEHPSVTVLPVTSKLRETPLFRISVNPDEGNGLQKRSQVMVDKAHTVPREKVGAPFGRLDDVAMLAVNRAMAVFLGSPDKTPVRRPFGRHVLVPTLASAPPPLLPGGISLPGKGGKWPRQ